MHFLTLLVAAVSPLTAHAFSAQSTLLKSFEDPRCGCAGIPNTTAVRSRHYCDNEKLGPVALPWRFPMLSLVSSYKRFGDLLPKEFLDKWWNVTMRNGKGGWNYPPEDGFQLDHQNQPIKGIMSLEKGFRVDRFGDEAGHFVSAADSPYAQRALPPSNLNVCPDPKKKCEPKDHPWAYHVYEVLQPFFVIGGPVAPAFEQPGLGAQFDTRLDNETFYNISTLVDAGYLKRLSFADLRLGPGPDHGSRKPCGKQPEECVCKDPNKPAPSGEVGVHDHDIL